MVSGAPPSAYWAANFCWDLINFCIPAAGIVMLVYAYHQPQLSGIRLAAMAVLLLAFGGAAINTTYLAHFMFTVSYTEVMPLLCYVDCSSACLASSTPSLCRWGSCRVSWHTIFL